MNIKTVTNDILTWSENFVEVPHLALGNWAPCPFARQARLKGTIGIFIGNDPYFDLESRAALGMQHYEVIIYAYDPIEWTRDYFSPRLKSANQDFLLAADLIVLEDHPDDVEDVNGVIMNQGKYALSLVQSLSDLDRRAQQMSDKGFYHAWPEQYLTGLFENRVDPRKHNV
jgi:hypothetical protein